MIPGMPELKLGAGRIESHGGVSELSRDAKLGDTPGCGIPSSFDADSHSG